MKYDIKSMIIGGKMVTFSHYKQKELWYKTEYPTLGLPKKTDIPKFFTKLLGEPNKQNYNQFMYTSWRFSQSVKGTSRLFTIC